MIASSARKRGSPGGDRDFIGREAQLTVLRDHIERAATGAGRIVLVEGEAGIGKSALLTKALVDAPRLGMLVHRAAAEELERRRPFAVVVDCLALGPGSDDPRRAEIFELLFSPTSADPALFEGLEFRVTERLLGLVDDITAVAPIALLFDDLQWADPASLAFIHRLGRQITRLPAVLLVAFRPTPRSPELDQLVRSLLGRGAVELTLGPLSDDEVAQLLTALAGAPPGPRLIEQASAAGGSPIYLRELVAALQQAGSIRVDDVADVETTGLPESLALTILHRLSFLSRPALEMLRVTSILGSKFSINDLSSVTDRSAIELRETLEESIDAGVLGTSDDTLHFRHDLIRDALYNDLPSAIRSGLHADAARALADAGAPAVRVAEHVLRGASAGDVEAVRWLQRAAADALTDAPAIAAEFLAAALDLGAEGREREEILANRARAVMLTGNMAEAQRACRDVLDHEYSPALEGPLRLSLAWSYGLQPLMAGAGIAETEAGIASENVLPSERAKLRALGAQIRLFSGDMAGSEEQALLARDEGTAHNEPWATSTANQALSLIANFRGEFRRAVETQNHAVRAAETSTDARHLPAHLTLGILLLDLDRLDEAVEEIRTGREIHEQLGVRWSMPLHYYARALALLYAGDLDDAAAELEAGLGLAEELDLGFAAIAALSLAGLIALHRNDAAHAEVSLSKAERLLTERGPDYRFVLSIWLRALLLEVQGDVEEASATAVNAWSLCSALGNLAECTMIGPDLVRMTLAGSQPEMAKAIAAGAEALAKLNPGVATVEGAALRCRGLIDRDADALVAAAAAYREGPRVLDRAAACEDAAVVLSGVKRSDEARELFREAFELYEKIGALLDLSRAEARARSAGHKRGVRGSRTRPKFGWDALTPTETRVVDYVAQGLSNREIADAMFLSPHTVHTHVSHALAKVGLTSRVALAAAHGARQA